MNRDASLFCSGSGSDLVARRDGVALWGCCDNALPRPAVHHTGPAGRTLQRNRFGRGRSSYRSRPACGSGRRGTAALTPPRHEMAECLVDLRHDCRDIGPAYVPSTGVGRGVETNRQVQNSAPCLSSREGQSYPPVATTPACKPCRPGPGRPSQHHQFQESRTGRNFRPSDTLRRIHAVSRRHRHSQDSSG